MTTLTISEAAKLLKKSTKTIYRHVNEGKLSAVKSKKGEYRFDAAELFRVYDEPKVNSHSLGHENSQTQVMRTTVHTDQDIENNKTQPALVAHLQNEIEYLRKKLDARESEAAQLRNMLDKAQSHSQQLVLGYKSQKFNLWDFFRRKEPASEL